MELVRYRDHAEYPAAHPCAREALTEEEAYARCGEASVAAFQRAAGTVLFTGRMACMFICPNDKRWDRIFIAHYSSPAAFLGMLAEPEYHATGHEPHYGGEGRPPGLFDSTAIQ